MTRKTFSTCLIGLSAALLMLVVSTQPARLPAMFLILPFALLFAVLSLLVANIVAGPGVNLTGRSLRTGGLVAALPTLLLVLQSLGQLTIGDGLVIFALFGVLYFYSYRLGRPVA